MVLVLVVSALFLAGVDAGSAFHFFLFFLSPCRPSHALAQGVLALFNPPRALRERF